MIDPRLEATVEIEIPFHDVDSIHMVWHGNHIKYFEIARTALTRLIKYDVAEMVESKIMWPVIECNCRYINAIAYGDIILVRAWISEVEHRLKVNYFISEKSTGKRLAKGYTTQAAVNVATGKLMETSYLQMRVKEFLDQSS